MVKRFGPTRGAGTVIEEQEGGKAITPGALGWVGYAGVFERGPVGELVLCSSKAEFLQRMGGTISDSLAPDAVVDYFNNSNGAGGVALLRIADGNQRQAQATLYTRHGNGSALGVLKAANGGRWGGKALRVTGVLASAAGVTNTTLQLPAPLATQFVTDQLKGGYIELQAVPNARYPIIGNTSAGLVVVASDQRMRTALGALTDFRFYITLENEGRGISYRIKDGEDRPDSEFGLEIYVNGELVKVWGNLHTDPLNARYWVNVINSDSSNFYVAAEDLWTGAHTADVRPANYYARTRAVTATTLTADVHLFQVNAASGTAAPTITLHDADNAQALDDVLTVTMTSPTAGNVVSARFGALTPALTLGTRYESSIKWIPDFTVTAGGGALASGDTLTLTYRPFKADALVGGYLYPDKPNAKLEHYRIVGNTINTITVATGSNLTTAGAIADMFMLSAPQELQGGVDGAADVVDADYAEQAWAVDSSPFNNLKGMGLGLVKFATPGVTSTAVQKAGVAYAEAKNHQYRYEAAANVTTEQAVLTLVNDTLGRSDYAVIAWPSYGSVPDPDPVFAREGRLKVVSLTGMIHGREARIASDYDGYHKAQAGVDATLPRLLKVPTGDRYLNEELLNPAGIAVIKKKQGSYVIWGDRTLHRDPTWRFKHQREQMSYYEQVLENAFDFIIFAINDARSDGIARAALRSFFRPEFTKRALRGTDFDDAAVIRVDEEINTDLTRGNGDKYAEVSLRLADTVERFIIKIGKQGIFESVA